MLLACIYLHIDKLDQMQIWLLAAPLYNVIINKLGNISKMQHYKREVFWGGLFQDLKVDS